MMSEQGCGVEHVVELVDSLDAAALGRGVEYGIVAGHRAGM